MHPGSPQVHVNPTQLPDQMHHPTPQTNCCRTGEERQFVDPGRRKGDRVHPKSSELEGRLAKVDVEADHHADPEAGRGGEVSHVRFLWVVQICRLVSVEMQLAVSGELHCLSMSLRFSSSTI